MREKNGNSTNKNLSSIGINKVHKALWNLEPAELIEISIKNKEGYLSDTGAFAADTGEFTGRSPKERYIVGDPKNENDFWCVKI